MGMEQRPQLFRWQTASTVAALPNNINLLSRSCWETENRTWNRPDSADTHTVPTIKHCEVPFVWCTDKVNH